MHWIFVFAITFFLNFGFFDAAIAVDSKQESKEEQASSNEGDPSNSDSLSTKDIEALLDEEVSITQQRLQSNLEREHQRLRQIYSERKKLRIVLRGKAKSQKEGIKLFDKYADLLKVRYIDANGEYDQDQELAQKDIDNINAMFKTYLDTKPFGGRLSARDAMAALNGGVDRLEKEIEANLDPSPENNLDFKILEKRKEGSIAAIEKIYRLAERVHLKIERKTVASRTKTRSLASKKSSNRKSKRRRKAKK